MIALYGCVSHPVSIQGLATELAASCLGSASLPHNFENKFEAIDNRQLLNEALGGTDEGKLCQGQVYRSKEASQVTVFRAWNSANPNSEFGNWWAFEKPSGEIAKYRSDYEICYQWSSIDKLVSCTLKPGTIVVVGTGQSAICSDYLNYPVSVKQQIYIDQASTSLSDCTAYSGEFSWK